MLLGESCTTMYEQKNVQYSSAVDAQCFSYCLLAFCRALSVAGVVNSGYSLHLQVDNGSPVVFLNIPNMVDMAFSIPEKYRARMQFNAIKQGGIPIQLTDSKSYLHGESYENKIISLYRWLKESGVLPPYVDIFGDYIGYLDFSRLTGDETDEELRLLGHMKHISAVESRVFAMYNV